MRNLFAVRLPFIVLFAARHFRLGPATRGDAGPRCGCGCRGRGGPEGRSQGALPVRRLWRCPVHQSRQCRAQQSGNSQGSGQPDRIHQAKLYSFQRRPGTTG